MTQNRTNQAPDEIWGSSGEILFQDQKHSLRSNLWSATQVIGANVVKVWMED
jgi:hypothetical protein